MIKGKAINIGLTLIECPEEREIRPLELLAIEDDQLTSLTTGRRFEIVPLPPFIRALIASGGVVAHFMQRSNDHST